MTEHLIENSAGYRFDPANNSADHYRLSRVLLEGAEDKRLEDPEWLRFVGRCIEFGSQNVNGTTVSQAKKAHQARNRFEYEAGLGRPDHPLHRALEIRKKQQQPLPFVLIDTVAALDEITGDGVNTINSCKILLGSTGGVLRQRVATMERYAHALGWEGDVRQLAAQKPRLLMRSLAYWTMLMRLAAQHGTAQDASLDIAAVNRLMWLPAESHMLAAIAHEDYRFGDTVSALEVKKKLGISVVRKRIHEALADDAVAERIGPAVVRSYLRYQPPSKETLAAAPHLYGYLHGKHYESFTPIQYVTGHEIWLKKLCASRHKTTRELADEINTLIAAGSSDLQGRPEDSPLYLDTVDARAALFKVLGIANRQHNPYYDKFLRFVDQESTLVMPQVLVTSCQLMSDYGVNDPLKVIQQAPHALLWPNQIEAKLAAINSEGIDINTALHYHPTLLLNKAAAIPHTLRYCRTAVRAKAAKTEEALHTHIPKGLRTNKERDELFDPLVYAQDFAALYLTTLDSTRLQSRQWIKEVMLAAEIGSQRRNRGDTVARIALLKDKRTAFEEATGLRDPNHPLFVAYARSGEHGMVPMTVLRVVQTMQNLTGHALTAIMQRGRLLGMAPNMLLKNDSHLGKLAATLGWRGSVQELIDTHPGVLASSYASRVIVARLAQEHAADNHAAMSSADIPALLHAAPEAHLMQLLRSEPYTFGDKVSPNEITKIGVKKVREYIHRAITTPAGAKKLGPAVIKAYLRFNPFP